MTSFSSFFLGKSARGVLKVCLLGLFFSVIGTGWALGGDFIPLAEISPGMTGYGLTVFEGSRIDTFGVRVVGIQQNVRVDGSLLMVEISGHGLEISSIAQGMSGSPIYLDDRFAGALAFGWGGALRPIAGVTPAEEMLALPSMPGTLPARETRSLDADLHRLVPGGASHGDLARILMDDESAAGREAGRPSGARSPENPDLWPAPRDLIMTLLEDLVPTSGGALPGPDSWIVQPVGFAGAADATAGSEQSTKAGSGGPIFYPGSACAVPLIMGDAKLGAIGTVTVVEDDRVLMFGHPFMQRGPVDLPLATAEILTVFPSRQMSFKMGTIGDIVGTVHHDQRAGLAGRTGPSPALIPVSVDVELAGTAGTESRSYAFQVADDPRLTPTMVFWAFYNSLLAEGDDASEQTISYRIETEWEGPPHLADEPLVLEGMTAGPGGAMGLASVWMAPLGILLNNAHEEVRLKEVRAHLTLTRPMSVATITGVSGPRYLPEAGGEVVFRVDLQPRKGQRESVEIPVVLPARMTAGPYRILAASSAELFAFEAQRAAGRFQTTSLGGLLDVLRTERAGNTLVLAILAPGRNMVVQGQELHDLPGSVSHLISSGNMQASRTLADYVLRGERTTDWVLDGFAVRSLHLKPSTDPIKEERRP